MYNWQLCSAVSVGGIYIEIKWKDKWKEIFENMK